MNTRRAFTLIELIVSISILTIIMLFLYKSYASLNRSNDTTQKEMRGILDAQKLKKVIFLDFSLALHTSTQIQNRDKKEDFVFLQSSNSIHKRHNPYITYIVKENKLYRLESLKAIKSYELLADAVFDIDLIGEVERFRVYKSSNSSSEIYLIDIDFTNMDDILFRIRVLNEA